MDDLKCLIQTGEWTGEYKIIFVRFGFFCCCFLTVMYAKQLSGVLDYKYGAENLYNKSQFRLG